MLTPLWLAPHLALLPPTTPAIFAHKDVQWRMPSSTRGTLDRDCRIKFASAIKYRWEGAGEAIYTGFGERQSKGVSKERCKVLIAGTLRSLF
jgi:hypothetical protein